jgi:DNA-binding GntR family transcriptional regulator
LSGSDPKRKGRPRRSAEVPLEDCRELDRDSEVPLYYQLGAALLESLEAHPWPPGARFATERELEARFGVSRVVVRRSLELLEGDGAIVRRQGSGAYIAPRRELFSVFGLLENLSQAHEETQLRVLRVREEDPDSAVSRFLILSDGESQICHLTGLLEIGGRRVGLLDSHVPIARLPWMAEASALLAQGKLPALPERIALTRSDVVIEHTFFGNWGGPKLGASPGDPALMTRFIQFGTGSPRQREAPLEFARIFYPARTTQIAFSRSPTLRQPS